MKTLSTDEERARVLSWLSWTLVTVLALHWARDLIAPIGWMFDQLIASLQGQSDKASLLLKDGDRALFGIALAALAVLVARGRGGHGAVLVGVAGLLVGTQLADLFLGGSRGALLGVLLGLFLLMSHGSPLSIRAILLGTATLSLALSSLTAMSAAKDFDATVPRGAVYESIAGRRSVVATLEQIRVEDGTLSGTSTVGWRLDIWADVIDEWTSSWTNRLFGIGFGTEIEAMTLPGRQGDDGMNRGVHSIAFTILARQGLVGMLATGSLLALLLSGPRRSRQVVGPVLAAGIAVALFDVFLEGVQAPIVLWTLIGFALVPQASRRSDLHSARR